MAEKARIVGFAAAAIGVIVDQATKLWMLGPFAIEAKGRVTVTPFLDLVMVWNRGVSYGLLEQDGPLGRWLLVAVGIGGTLLFSWWLWSTRRILAALSLGLIIAGAFSNVIDRLRLRGCRRFLPAARGGISSGTCSTWPTPGSSPASSGCCSPGRWSAAKSPRRHEI